MYPIWMKFNSIQVYLDEEWNTRKTYRTSKSNVQRLSVVNDCAKRGVKLASEFADTARKSSNLSNTVQVVEKISTKITPICEKKDEPNYTSNFPQK